MVGVPPAGIVGSEDLRHNPSFSGSLASGSKKFETRVYSKAPTDRFFVPHSCGGMVEPMWKVQDPEAPATDLDWLRLQEAMGRAPSSACIAATLSAAS